MRSEPLPNGVTPKEWPMDRQRHHLPALGAEGGKRSHIIITARSIFCGINGLQAYNWKPCAEVRQTE